MVKENKKELHDYLKSNNINNFYILTNKEEEEKKIMEAFGLNDVESYKCIFYSKSSDISLILEDNIEYLTEEMIEYYLKRNSEQEDNTYNNKNKENFKRALEQNEFKNILKQFTREINLEIEFRDIGKKKYPVNLRVKYHEIDKEIAFKTKKELEKILNAHKITYYFISELVKEGNIYEKNEILMKQSQEKDKRIEELKEDFSKKIKNFEEEKQGKSVKIKKLEEENKIKDEKIKKLEEGKKIKDEKIKKLEEEKKIKDEKIKKLEKYQEENAKKITVLKEENNELTKRIKINEDEKKIVEF